MAPAKTPFCTLQFVKAKAELPCQATLPFPTFFSAIPLRLGGEKALRRPLLPIYRLRAIVNY